MLTPHAFSRVRRRTAVVGLFALVTLGLPRPHILAEDAKPKPGADATPSDEAGMPTRFVLKATLEDGGKTPLSLKLQDGYRRKVKAWTDVQPGELSLEAPKLEPESYLLWVAAKGYTMRFVRVSVSKEGLDIKPDKVELARLRYAILRYDVNVKGKRALIGGDVLPYRVAVTHLGHLPELNGDYMIRQDRGDDGRKVQFSFHRIGSNHGFVAAPAGKKFDEIDTAPPPSEYKCEDVTCEPGMILFTRVVGHQANMQRYAKVLIEDVTETPPKDAKLIESGDFWKDEN